jgi:hypothetical protein
MGVDRIEAVGLLVSVLAIIVFYTIIVSHAFPTFEYAPSTSRLIKTTQPIGPETARFMWAHRSMDLIAQALVLFAAAVGCLAILRTEEGETK